MQVFYFYLISGIVLIISEAIFNTFYLLVIGVVFILSSLLALLVDNWVIITVISTILSIIACALIKIYKQKHKMSDPKIAEHIGHTVEVVEIASDKLRVQYSGSYWDARLKSKNIKDIKIGDVLTITKYHNNEFEVD
ncbi:MAG TPA: NfeD family protein [Aquella sp.]|nr:NfeD family protein [Aquella sp.]